MKKMIPILFWLLFIAGSVTAQNAAHLSLPYILSEIDKSYPLLRLCQNRINGIKALAKGAKSWMPPTVSLAIDKVPCQLGMIKENSPMNRAGIMFSAEQMIPNQFSIMGMITIPIAPWPSLMYKSEVHAMDLKLLFRRNTNTSGK